MSVGILLAPLLGGVVYERAGYYPVFYMAFGLIALDILLRMVLIEKKIARQWLRDEVPDSEGASSPEELSKDAEKLGTVTGSHEHGSQHNEKSGEDKLGLSTSGAIGGQTTPRKVSPDNVEQVAASGGRISDDRKIPETQTTPTPTKKRTRWPPVLTLLKSRRLLTALWWVFSKLDVITKS